jgi:chromosome partitioning protein
MARARVFTVENRKGGVGKTTTAVNLAVGIAQVIAPDGRVLLIDLDPQGDAALALGVDVGGRCISRLFLDETTRFADVIIRADSSMEGGPQRPNLFLLPSSDELKAVKDGLLAQIGAMEVMKKFAANTAVPTIEQKFNSTLGRLKDVFDYIIIDCPPTLDTFQRAVHEFADGAIVPVRLDYHGARGTARHTQNIADDRDGGSQIVIKAIVPTFVQPRLRLTRAMYDSLVKQYGKLVRHAIPDRIAVAEAPALGGFTIIEHEPDNDAAEAYRKLVAYIMED